MLAAKAPMLTLLFYYRAVAFGSYLNDKRQLMLLSGNCEW